MFYNDNNWNLIAQIIFKLQNKDDIGRKILFFKSLTKEKREEILLEVSFRLGACGFLDDTKTDIFEKLIIHLPEDELDEHLMEALHYIDMKMNHNNDSAIFMLDRTISVSQMRKLNKNEDKLGIMILPRLKCAWSSKAKSGVEMSVSKGINELMQNYYYINKKDLGKYEICNYMVRNGNGTHTPAILRIAVSPLTNADVLTVKKYVKDGREKIAIVDVAGSEIKQRETNQYSVNEIQLMDRVEKIIDASSMIKADILMFPEMLGTEEIRKSSLRRLAKLDLEEGRCTPLLTLLPSEWKYSNKDDNTNGSKCNTNTLYVACRGNIIDGDTFKESFRQQKQNPYFENEGNLAGKVEDIESDNKICVLHMRDVGRITFPICADLISDEYRKILIDKLGSTLILCPSFSKGFDAFIKLTNIGIASGCRIVWCNSCAVRHLYNEQGMFKESDICCTGVPRTRNCFLAKPDVKCTNGQCADSCLFYIDIPLSMILEGGETNLYWNHLIS